MAEKPKAISQDTAEAYALLGIPYEGYVEGIGYQSLMAQTLGSCYFEERGCAIPQFEQVMDSSPEMRIQSVGYQHKVKAGDTLTSISQHYGITIASIMAANPGIDWPNARNNGDLIFAGETLALPNLGTQEALPKDASSSTSHSHLIGPMVARANFEKRLVFSSLESDADLNLAHFCGAVGFGGSLMGYK